MRLAALCLLVPFFAFAQSKARPLEIDTVTLVQRPDGKGYTLQYSESGANRDGSPLVRVGDPVPLLTGADQKVVKPFFDFAHAKLGKGETLGTITVAKVVGGKYEAQHTAIGKEDGQPTLTRSPLHEMATPKERKEAEALFALAKRARTGK
jgi:hypothetical protein